MQAKHASRADWKDGAAYAPLLDADRSLFAWEWLRRDPDYRAAARGQASLERGIHCARASPDLFGLVAFEDPDLAVPHARPLWRADVHPPVLPVERGPAGGAGEDRFILDRSRDYATLIASGDREQLLLSDGLRAIRLDGPEGIFTGGSVRLRYLIDGVAAARPLVATLRRFIAFSERGRFARDLHRREPRARRWVLLLRAWDALSSGAGQREIAAELLSRSASGARWRTREPSIRSQAQRLVRCARELSGFGYRRLLR